MKTIHILLVFGLVLALLSGCATFGDHRYSGDTNRYIDIKTLALMLNDSLRRPSLKNKEIGILTFADLNNLDDVQPLIGELKLTRLKEILKRTEFAEIKSLVMGTYIDAGDYIYVNGKVVALENSTVMGSGEIKIRKGEYLHKLLNLEEDPLTDKTSVY